MTPEYATVAGVLKPDGTLELAQPLRLPPGPVEVTVKTVVQAKGDIMAVLKEIWADRQARGALTPTAEEIDAEINELRDELEEHITAAEDLQRQCLESKE